MKSPLFQITFLTLFLNCITGPQDCRAQFDIRLSLPEIDVPEVPSLPEIERKAMEAGDHIKGKAIEAAQHINRDLKNFDQERLKYQRLVLLPQLAAYHGFLQKQANGKQKSLPPDLISILAPHYRDIDLRRVRYAENINTGHGMGITVGYSIYFPTSINLSNGNHMQWLLHELEHVSQYRAAGGVEAFSVKYLANGAQQMFSQGKVNVHGNIALERDANNKAARIFGTVMNSWTQMQNGSAGSFALAGMNQRTRYTGTRTNVTFESTGTGRWVARDSANRVIASFREAERTPVYIGLHSTGSFPHVRLYANHVKELRQGSGHWISGEPGHWLR